MIGKLRKLKGRSFAEIIDRSRQRSSVIAERIGASSLIKLPSDAKFFSLIKSAMPDVTAAGLLTNFRSGQTPRFYRSFDDPDATVSLLRQRFLQEEAAIIKRADRIREGYFDLLGYENLFFESKIPNWHFDPISKKTSPMVHWSRIDETSSEQTGDKKIIWELNRHQYFTTLGRAYWLTKDENYAQTFIDHIEDWMTNNPPKIGLHWISSLEIAFRSISWLWILHFFRNSPKLTPEVYVRMLKFLYLNGRHIESYLSTYSSPNTHLTGEALGLYFLGTFLPEFKDAERWKNLGYEILLNALDFQVRPDGVYCEQSSQYHRYTTDFYLSLMILRQNEGLEIDQIHRYKLNQLLEFLLCITQPNGETPLFGDDDGGRLHFLDESSFADFRSTLAVGAVLFDDASLKFAATDANAELLWLFGPDGLKKYDEITPIQPKETAKAFNAGGFYTFRSSWDDSSDYLLIDCGEHGFLNSGHAHADALHFVLSVNGRPVFIDAGTYNYTADAEARELFRSTAAHNCLTVNSESSSIPDGPFSWRTAAKAKMLEWKHENNNLKFRGTHDGFERFGVSYERVIEYNSAGNVTLNEDIRCNSSNSYELNFILSPDIEAEIAGDQRPLIHAKEGKHVLLTIDTKLVSGSDADSGSWHIEPFSVSLRYGSLIDSTKLVFKVKAIGDLSIRNTITFCS
jgi:Heparinase II/III N-terminus/Heparinase II/III-like protein